MKLFYKLFLIFLAYFFAFNGLFISTCFAQSTTGLVAYYPFTGNTADSSGNHNDGVITGGVTLTADRFGNPNSAYHFDGSSGYILCPNASQLIGSKNVSYSAWFRVQNRPSGWDQNVILANIGPYESSGGFEAFTSNPPGTYASMFRNATHNDQQLNGTDSIQPDVWYQLLVIMRYDSILDNTTVTNYIDCVFDDSMSFPGSINYDNISQLWIGANQDIGCCQRYFLGDIDEVKIYDIDVSPCGLSTTYTFLTDTVNIACGDSFAFGGVTYYLPVTKTDTFSGANADTIVTLHLNVTDTVYISQIVCPGDSLLFYGAWLHYPIQFDTLIHTPNYCDSLLILNTPIIDPLPPLHVYDTICGGDSLLFNGVYLDTTGVYTAHYTPQQGCDSTVILALMVSPAPAALVRPDSALICSNDSAQLCASAGYTYQWNTGEQSICIYVQGAGNYYVTVTDANQCTAESNHAMLDIFPVPSVSVIVFGDTLESYNATAYQWYLNGQVINGATTNIFIASRAGDYAVQVTDSNGCIALSSTITYTGIENITNGIYSLNLYPNPAHDYLTVEYNGFTANSQIEVVDVLGRVVKTERINGPVINMQVDIHALTNGLYFLRIVNDAGAISEGKFSMVK